MIVVIRLLDHRGMYFPRTHVLGAVEIRHRRADTTSERAALGESCAAFGDARPDDCMRIATVVDANSQFEADAVAEERFEEALDVLGSEGFGMTHLALLESGCFFSVSNGGVAARTPDPRGLPTTVFRVMREPFPRLDWPQFLLSEQQTELSQRIVRSYHWTRRASAEANRQLRVLFRWFAMEAIWMISRDDDIVPRVMWSLGFPNGAGAAVLSSELVGALKAHPTISAWKPQIDDRLRAIKTMRNNAVHSGFRRQDVPKADLKDFDWISMVACGRVQSLARAAVLARLDTAQAALDYLPILVEADANYVNDVHGNIIYGLENPSPRAW